MKVYRTAASYAIDETSCRSHSEWRSHVGRANRHCTTFWCVPLRKVAAFSSDSLLCRNDAVTRSYRGVLDVIKSAPVGERIGPSVAWNSARCERLSRVLGWHWSRCASCRLCELAVVGFPRLSCGRNRQKRATTGATILEYIDFKKFLSLI